MSILFSRNTTSNIKLKSYETPQSIALDYVETTTTIENALYIADIMLETTYYDDDNLQEILEETKEKGFKGFVEGIKTFVGKIKEWIGEMIKKIGSYFTSAKKFVEKYKDAIKSKDPSGYVFETKFMFNKWTSMNSIANKPHGKDFEEAAKKAYEEYKKAMQNNEEAVFLKNLLDENDKGLEELKKLEEEIFGGEPRKVPMSSNVVNTLMNIVETGDGIMKQYNDALTGLKHFESNIGAYATVNDESEDGVDKIKVTKAYYDFIQKSTSKNIALLEKSRSMQQKAITESSRILKKYAMTNSKK